MPALILGVVSLGLVGLFLFPWTSDQDGDPGLTNHGETRANTSDTPANAPSDEQTGARAKDLGPLEFTSSDMDANHDEVGLGLGEATQLEDASDAPSPGETDHVPLVATSYGKSRRDEETAFLDPAQDGWDTEAFAEQASAQLKRIAKLVAHSTSISVDDVHDLVAAEFACGSLSPELLQADYRDRAVVVQRGQGEATDSKGTHTGAPGLVAALKDFARPFAGTSDVHAKFKRFRTDPTDQAIVTVSLLEASGRTDGGSLQQKSTWSCRWVPSAAGDNPRLESIRVLDYEVTTAKATEGTLFTDRTDAVLGDCRCYHDQFSHGIDSWAGRLERRIGMDIYGHNGIAIGDVNGDGWDDIYVCQPPGLPNRLLIQNGDGTMRDASAAAGVDVLDYSSCALLVDMDNDGDQDLVLSTLQGLYAFANTGQGTFTQKNKVKTPQWAALSAADYDRDGDLDLYLATYRAETDNHWEYPYPLPYHDANNGGRNVLLQNQGGWQFTDVTAQAGLDVNNRRFSFAAAWEDYDNDGDLDVYVANDFGRNNLYRNTGGRFTDVAAEASAEDIASGMSVSWADYNRDGRMDLYVSNMFSAAGNRVAYQRRFQEHATEKTKSDLRRLARGNSLFENADGRSFRDVSETMGVTMGRWAWASQFVDINNDGWEDLIVTNGMITTQDTGDL